MKRRIRILLAAALAAALLTACGGSGGGSKNYNGALSAPSETMADSEGWGGEYDYAESVDTEAPMAPAGEDASGGSGETRPEKIIRTAQLNLETTSFDQAAAALEQLASELGGYVESGSVGDRGSGYSWGDYTIRVPSARFDEFLARAGELCHETWRSVERENISERYYDTAGRLKTQQIKLERLQELLSQAEEMADIITIESAISETEWMIEDLSGTLRHYDAQVDYSTIQVNLQEVYRLSNVEEAPVSFAGRLGTAFKDGLRAFGDWLENLAVALAYSWMWWLLLAVIVVLVIRLIRRRRRTREAWGTGDQAGAYGRPKKLGRLGRRKGPAQAPGSENGDDKSEDP